MPNAIYLHYLQRLLLDDREENVAKGSVPYKVYIKYFSSGVGWLSTMFMIFSLIFGQVRIYRKIPLIRPGHIYGQRANLMGLYSGGLYTGGLYWGRKNNSIRIFLTFVSFFQSSIKHVFRYFSRHARCEIQIHSYGGQGGRGGIIFGMLIWFHIWGHIFGGRGLYRVSGHINRILCYINYTFPYVEYLSGYSIKLVSTDNLFSLPFKNSFYIVLKLVLLYDMQFQEFSVVTNITISCKRGLTHQQVTLLESCPVQKLP